MNIICRLAFFIFFYVHASFASPQGDVRIKLNSILNPLGTTSTNECCSGTQNSWNSKCSEECRVYVTVCLTAGTIDHRWSCSMGSKETRVFNKSSTDFNDDAEISAGDMISIPENTTRENENNNIFLFRIKETNRDETKFRLLVKFHYVADNQREVEISEHVTTVTFKPHGVWRTAETDNEYGPNLKYSLHVKCDENYGSDSCSYHCTPRDNIAHFDCDKDFKPVCHPGWTGEFCTIPICAQKCKHGWCSIPDKCWCYQGWEGKKCSECKTKQGCLHGDCELPYECKCFRGWAGEYCDEPETVCSLSPCVHAHACQEIGDDYYCSCKHGWAGKNCTEDLNDCKGQCQNNATCLDEVNGGYSCHCQPGFSGRNCEIEINECVSSPCLNQGICKNEINSYKCVCQTGFFGDNCSVSIDFCESDPCLHQGSCRQLHNDYKCHCENGWTGRNCENLLTDIKTTSCKHNPCKHDSTCYLQSGEEKCLCPVGYTGRFCHVDIDDCRANPCENAGTCVDRVDAYQCVCTSGFEGKHCEININECERRPCQNGGLCIDGVNSFSCQCPTGYRGHDCSYNVNDCANVICKNGGVCLDQINGYLCKCKEGHMGKHCELRSNKCLEQPCIHGKCMEQVDGFACMCDLGYIGELCNEEINECVGVLCENGATCVDRIGHYECNCSHAFYGLHCEYADACKTNVCGNNGRCTREGDDYKCHCRSGYFGQHCEQVEDGCKLNIYNASSKTIVFVPREDCGSHGKCVSLGKDDWKCKCAVGWTGDRCNIDINNCENHWCRNSGTCVDGENDYTCMCASGYTGKYCEVVINECSKSPCQNGGRCIDVLNDFNCSCVNGWKGKICNSKATHCDPHPCLNGGSCIDVGETFHCNCHHHFVGPTCAQTKDYCSPKTCLNGGTCVNGNSSFECICTAEFKGKYCEYDIDACESQPCKYGGLCINHIKSFECKCTPGYTGIDCSFHENTCQSNPCPQNLQCENWKGSYRCICSPGTEKSNCKEAIKGKSCLYHNRTYQSGRVWESECHQCTCQNGYVSCDAVRCRLLNCFENQHSNCTCRENKYVDCITPPCKPWGECVVEVKTASIVNGGCMPTLLNPYLNKDCSTVNVQFQKALLPTGVLVQEICEELRYASVLQTLGYGKIKLDCKRFSHDANLNELVISIYVKEKSITVATLVANYLKENPNQRSVLQILNRTVEKVYIRRYTDINYDIHEFNMMIPLIGGLVLVSLLILLSTCVFLKIRRKRYNRYKEEVFFTQQQNVFGINGQFKAFESEQVKNKKSNIKDSLHQTSNNLKKQSITRVNDNEYLPDKLYLSEPNKKFSHC